MRLYLWQDDIKQNSINMNLYVTYAPKIIYIWYFWKLPRASEHVHTDL